MQFLSLFFLIFHNISVNKNAKQILKTIGYERRNYYEQRENIKKVYNDR